MEDSTRPGLNIPAALRGTQDAADDLWIEHCPFVSWLVDALQPRVIADLVRDGDEPWIPFCEAAQSLTTCRVHVARDNGNEADPTWVDTIVRNLPASLLNWITVHAGDVSDLVAAVGPGTVDLLHLDKADDAFRDPLRRALSPSAVVVSNEPLTELPGGRVHSTFEFTHAGGLQITVLGEDPPAPLRKLTSLPAEDSHAVRALFESLGSGLRIGEQLRERQLAGAGLARELSHLQAAHANLKLENDRLAREVVLQMEASQANAAAALRHEQSLENVYRSPSWRITAPLRAPAVLRKRRAVRRAGRFPVAAHDDESDGYPPPQTQREPNEDDALAAAIRHSGLVDEAWYQSRYPEVAESACDPVSHQLGYFGWQGLGWGGLGDQDPNPWFDSRWYRTRYGDDLAPGHAPVVDYLRADPREARDPSFWFDARWFRDHGQAPDDLDKQALVAFREAGWPRQLSFPGRLRREPRPRVVFVSGQPDHPGHRYRVLDPASALPPDRFDVAVMAVDEWPERRWVVDGTDLLWIWRAPMSPKLEEIIAQACSSGARVIADVDDLVLDDSLSVEHIDGIRSQGIDPQDYAASARMMRETLAAADLVLVPTSSLAAAVESFGFTSSVLPNGHDAAYSSASSVARSRRGVVQDARIRLGYAAGSKTHQRDLAVAAPAIASVLKSHEQVRLVLFRDSIDLAEFPDLAERAAQIEWRDPVALEELPHEYARFDVNLAPLEVGNTFCESKSALKFNEAALVGVPTVASPTRPFTEAISPGIDGFLASSTDEWEARLEALISDSALRHEVGERARREVQWRCGPELRTMQVTRVVECLLAGTIPPTPLTGPLTGPPWPPARPVTPRGGGPTSHAECVRSDPGRVTVMLQANQVGALECLGAVPAAELRSLDLLLLDPGGDERDVLRSQWDGMSRQLARTIIISTTGDTLVDEFADLAAQHVRTEWLLWLPRHSALATEGVKRLLQIADATRRPIVAPAVLPAGTLEDVEILALGDLSGVALVSTALATCSPAVIPSGSHVNSDSWAELTTATSPSK